MKYPVKGSPHTHDHGCAPWLMVAACKLTLPRYPHFVGFIGIRQLPIEVKAGGVGAEEDFLNIFRIFRCIVRLHTQLLIFNARSMRRTHLSTSLKFWRQHFGTDPVYVFFFMFYLFWNLGQTHFFCSWGLSLGGTFDVGYSFWRRVQLLSSGATFVIGCNFCRRVHRLSSGAPFVTGCYFLVLLSSGAAFVVGPV